MKFWNRLIYYGLSIFEILFGMKNGLSLIPLFLRKSSGAKHQVQLWKPPIRLNIRGAMDVWAVKETFLDAFYTRYGVQVEDGWTVVDIGAGIGDFSILAAYSKPRTVVYAFEPFRESYQLMLENLTLNEINNVYAFQKAVWRESGTLMLDLSGKEPLQIASRDLADQANGEGVVQAMTLADILTQHDLKTVDLLKLDCEGAEYAILMEAPVKVLTRICRIIMEYHDLDEVCQNLALKTFLEGEGYTVTLHENCVHDDIGYLFAQRLSAG